MLDNTYLKRIIGQSRVERFKKKIKKRYLLTDELAKLNNIEGRRFQYLFGYKYNIFTTYNILSDLAIYMSFILKFTDKYEKYFTVKNIFWLQMVLNMFRVVMTENRLNDHIR